MTSQASITRFDFDQLHRDMLNAAVRMDVIDAFDLVEYVSQHGTDAEAILKEVDAAADSMQHTNKELRSAWFQIREAVAWFAHDEANPSTDDKFGFRADARAKSTKTLSDARIRL